jgi:hypothetical protein
MDNIDRFWLSLGAALHINAPKYFGKDDVKSNLDFLLKFHKEQWRVVSFIDEYDTLRKAHDNIRSSFFGTMCTIKSSRENFVLLSSVAIGSFSILHLYSSRIKPPFIDSFRNPNFTLEQVQAIYNDFEDDFKMSIDPEIIKDIYNRTNEYVKLIGESRKIKI